MNDSETSFNNAISRRQTWAIGFLVWTVIGLSFASRSYFALYRDGVVVPWYEIFSGFLVDFYIWGAVSPLIFRLARRFPVERGRLTSRIPLHIVLSAILILFVNAVSIPAYW